MRGRARKLPARARTLAAALALPVVLGASAFIVPGTATANEVPFAVLARETLAQAPGARPAPGAADAAGTRSGEASRLPRLDLSPQIVYQYLLAEIAAQRGQFPIAAFALIDLARSTRDPRIAQRAVEVSVQGAGLKAAIDAASVWVDIEPESIPARQTVAALLVNSGQLGAARPHLERLLAAEGNNIGPGFLQLNALFAKQPDRAAVLRLVRELAAKHPQLREARLAVAQAAWNAQSLDLALAETREAQRLSPDWEPAALFEAQILARRSNAEAIAQLEKFVAANPKATEARLSLARLYASDNRLPQSRDEFKRLAGDFPDNAELALAVALLSLQLEDLDTAEPLLRKLLDARPKDPNPLRFYLGRIAEARKRLPEAVKWFRAVDDGEQLLPARLAEASLLARLGRMPEAREALRRIVPDSLAQRVQLTLTEAQLLRDAKDLKAAFDVLGEALTKLPDSPELLYDQALIADRLDRLDVVEKNLRRVIEIQPDHAHAHNALGYTLADRNLRLDEAFRLIDIALKLSPDDPYILDSMGWVFFRMGQSARALEYLRRAFSIKPDAEIAAHLGEVLWAQGEREEARRVWDQALKADPGNETLQGTVKRLRR